MNQLTGTIPSPIDPFQVRDFLMQHSKVPDGTNAFECYYHYTTANVLEEFLKDEGDILCTHCRAVNDRSEFVAGINLLAEYMKARRWNADLSRQILDLMNSVAQYDLHMPWIFSLSMYNDSLFQWSNYTDKRDGGYAIGFSAESLMQLSARRVAKGNQNIDCPVSTVFSPCLYVGIDDTYGWLDRFFNDYITSGTVFSSPVNNACTNEVFSLASIAVSFIKEKSFFIEGESRLVLEPNFDAAYSDIVSIGGRPRLRARVKDDIGSLRDAIKSVIVSPHGNKESLYLNALNLKRRHKANFSIAVSSSTYRG